MGLQLIDFMKVIGLSRFFKDHVHIEKSQSSFSPDKLSQLLILQNILGYDRQRAVSMAVSEVKPHLAGLALHAITVRIRNNPWALVERYTQEA